MNGAQSPTHPGASAAASNILDEAFLRQHAKAVVEVATLKVRSRKDEVLRTLDEIFGITPAEAQTIFMDAARTGGEHKTFVTLQRRATEKVRDEE